MVSKPLGIVLQLTALWLVFSAYSSWVDGDGAGSLASFGIALLLALIGGRTKNRQEK